MCTSQRRGVGEGLSVLNNPFNQTLAAERRTQYMRDAEQYRLANSTTADSTSGSHRELSALWHALITFARRVVRPVVTSPSANARPV